MGLNACPSVRAGGDSVSLGCDCRGVGVFALAVGGLGVCAEEEDPWFEVDARRIGFEVVFVLEAGLLACEDSAFLRFLRPAFSFSAFSIMTLLMRSNSEQIPMVRCTPPVSISCPNADRKVTTMFKSRVSDLARGSRGFCRMFPNKVTSAVTGKYKTILSMLVYCPTRIGYFAVLTRLQMNLPEAHI